MLRVHYAGTFTTYMVFTYSSFIIYYSVGERTWVFAAVQKIINVLHTVVSIQRHYIHLSQVQAIIAMVKWTVDFSLA